ncbi:hypothetical protein [Timonella senegalensis]|uniref:hypothetical protein n=1 Tax=Timonella senegalensis TaxID=1465825 RepID=UPI0028A87045|nr:hypothetical protein [Timonella senegalensis]
MTVNLAALTSEQLSALEQDVADEQARRKRTAALAAEYSRLLDTIRQDAANSPIVPFDPIPQWDTVTGFAPGARVLYDDVTYTNVGRCYLAVPPPDSADWKADETTPEEPLTPLEPAEPEPEPEQLPEGEVTP